MRDFRKQTTQFLDDLFNGTIVTNGRDRADVPHPDQRSLALAMTPRGVEDNEDWDKLEALLKKYGELVGDYIETGPTKVRAAELYECILALRFVGFFRNNPNNLAELNFYKDRFKIYQEDLQERDRHIVSNSETIKQLRGELVGKGMSQ